MITRKEHMDRQRGDREENMRFHREYYAQFVTPYVKDQVLNAIGKKRIMASQCPHFNDIPLREWDNLAGNNGCWMQREVRMRLKEAGDFMTLGNAVCILKEAARQIKEDSPCATE